ncbi:MAG: CocE/NonD family hydrolase [Thermoanaerobaculia bacterium]|nr:CocE/NonD family hydrolase [Thermoanaerobaculia bacterium]
MGKPQTVGNKSLLGLAHPEEGQRARLGCLLVLALFLHALPTTAITEQSSPSSSSRLWSLERTGVSTPDGIWLATDVYMPQDMASTKVSCVLMRTPYGRDQFRDGHFLVDVLTARGYVVVFQDVRGKWGSTGQFQPFVNEQRDGTTTLDWIVRQPWSDGRVAMWGASYPGFAGLVMLPTRHPALETVVNISGWLDPDPMSRPGGAHHLMLTMPWLLQQATESRSAIGEVDLEELFGHLPLIEAFDAIGVDVPAWKDPSLLDPVEHDLTSRPISPSILHVTGWFDFVAPSTLSVYRELASLPSPPRQRLLVGPWNHNQIFTDYAVVGETDFGPESVMGLAGVHEMTLRWLASEMPVSRNSSADAVALPDPSAVRVFMMGDRWHDFESWPPRRAEVRHWYLVGSESGGKLSTEPPSDDAVPTALPSDPMNPVPTLGGANFHLFAGLTGPLDQRGIEARDDVVTFTSEPLREPMLVTGPVRARIYLSTEGRGADLVGKFEVVRSDGRVEVVSEGVVRSDIATGLIAPGQVVALDIDLGETALRLDEGMRIRLQLAGSSFPKYDRNPHTGIDSRTATELRAVTHQITSNGQKPSSLSLSYIRVPEEEHPANPGSSRSKKPRRSSL